MEFVAIVIIAALIQYTAFSARVGGNRGKLGVSTPKTTGNDLWERMYRVQQNTLEQLIVFIPAIVIFSTYVSAQWALVPGILYLVGRQLYSSLYIKDPKSRGPGFLIGFASTSVLMLGGLIGAIMNLVNV